MSSPDRPRTTWARISTWTSSEEKQETIDAHIHALMRDKVDAGLETVLNGLRGRGINLRTAQRCLDGTCVGSARSSAGGKSG